VVVVRGFFPHLSAAEARAVARTAVHLVSGLLLAAMAGPTRDESAMISETKVALRAYLAAGGRASGT
jgi:hypothetical protein